MDIDLGSKPLSELSFSDIFDFTSLLDAWDKTLRKGGQAAGGDGVTVGDFSSIAQVTLENTALLLAQGTYRPGPVRTLSFPKKSGGNRVLNIPCVVDRVVQRALAGKLSGALEQEFERSSFAYRPGRSVSLAARNITSGFRHGLSYVFEGDVDDYFDQIPQDRLLDMLAQYGLSADFDWILRLWLAPCSVGGRGLPQGAPISPVLSNLYLDPLDEEMDAKTTGQWVRYADDFVFLCPSEKAAQNARSQVAKILDGLGLRLHPEKTKIGSFDGGFSFLGRLFLKSFVLEDADGLDSEEVSLLNATGKTAPVKQVEVAKPVENDQIQPPSIQTPAKPVEHLWEGVSDPLPQEQEEDDSSDSDHLEGAGRSGVFRTLYAMRRGNRIETKGMTLRVVNDGDVVWQKHITELDRIDVGSQAEISPSALELAIENNIAVYFLRSGGDTLSLAGRESDMRAKLHLAQAEHVILPSKRLSLSRTLISTKIYNQRRVIQRWLKAVKAQDDAEENPKSIGLIEELERRLKPLDVQSKKAMAQEDIGVLFGLEGDAEKKLYACLGAFIRSDFPVVPRQRYQPTDPLNHLLNSLSWMLARDIATMIRRAGLHSGYSFFHSVQNGRQSLVYDLMEPFRPGIVTALAANCLRKGWVQLEDFPDHAKKEHATPRMTHDGFEKVLRSYERWVGQNRLGPRDAPYSWRDLMRGDVSNYAQSVLGKAKYQPYRLDL